MVTFQFPNPYFIGNSATNFLTEPKSEELPNFIFNPTMGEENRYPIRILVIGIPPGVTSVINELHVRGFAEVHGWSRAISVQNPGEIMRVMTRYFVMN